MARMTGKEALAKMLAAEGVEYIFGNPGTSETPFLDVLQDYPSLRYIQALQEGTAVGMADGYARATGKPAFANIHIAGGLANGISALYNAYRGGTPLVLTAGNSDTRMLLSDPVLSGDLVEMTQQFTKWSAEIPHAGNIPMAVRRAFKEALTPPVGPVFLSFPWDTMDEEVDVDIIAILHRLLPDASRPGGGQQRGGVAGPGRKSGASHRRPGGAVGRRRGTGAGGRTAGRQGVRQFLHLLGNQLSPQPRPVRGNAQPEQYGHPPAACRSRRGAGGRYQRLLLLPVRFRTLPVPEHEAGPPGQQPEGNREDLPHRRGHPCDPKAGLAELADALDAELSAPAREAAATRAATLGDAKRQARAEYLRRMQAMPDTRPMPVDRMMYELAQALPDNAIIADEAITSRGALLQAVEPSEPGSYYAIRGGALGWAMPGSLGIQLANPDRPVVAVVGDGASMYTVQALWTAARYNIPVTYAICNNRSYRILKVNMDVYLRNMLEDNQRDSEYVGMDFATALPLAEVAEAMGVAGRNVADPAELRPALEQSIASGKPSVINVSIDGSL